MALYIGNLKFRWLEVQKLGFPLNHTGHQCLGVGFKDFYFHPYFGKIPNLINIFQMGWNHQPDVLWTSLGHFPPLNTNSKTRKIGHLTQKEMSSEPTIKISGALFVLGSVSRYQFPHILFEDDWWFLFYQRLSIYASFLWYIYGNRREVANENRYFSCKAYIFLYL